MEFLIVGALIMLLGVLFGYAMGRETKRSPQGYTGVEGKPGRDGVCQHGPVK